MKKLMMIAAMMLMSIGAFAQEGKMAVGANLGYAAYGNSYNPFGIGAKLQYEFVENIRGEFAYNYWFPKDKVGMMDFNLNFQYLFPVAEDIKIYPLVGVNMATQHGDIDEKESIFGFNFGAGAEYYLESNLKLNLDIKYQHNKKTKSVSGTAMGQPYSYDLDIKFSGPVFQMGIAYIF